VAEKKDLIYMKLALAEALKGLGKTSPNPLVGAVIVKNGRIISKGYHEKAGSPHAEAIAIEKAGNEARGSTLYVTLEPCVHYGRTPPCAPRIVKAGIKKVFIGTRDPNPKVRGKGIEHLRKNGVEVEVGLLRESLSFINRGFFKRITRGKPWITLKVATGTALDMTPPEELRYISSSPSLEIVHSLRASHDIVAIGSNTLFKDAPFLNVRLKCREKLNTRDPEVVVFSRKSREEIIKEFKKIHGKYPAFVDRFTETVPLERKQFSKFLEDKAKQGVNYILIEGGAGVVNFLMEQFAHGNEDFLDEIYIFYTGNEALPPRLFKRSFSLKKFPLRFSGKSGNDLLLYFSKRWINSC